MDEAPISMPALGRPFVLGTLYDKNSDTLITGPKIWSKQETDSFVQKQNNPSMNCEFLTETSLSKKANSLNISGGMSLSLLSGMINVSGSGKYITNSTVKNETEIVTYKLDVKTRFEELHLSPNVRVTDIARFHGATHVVTGIQFGGTAFFTFERSKEDSSSKDQTSGNFQAQISKFSSLFSISGSAGMETSTEDSSEMEKIKVTYMGDFHLVSPPTNFIEAIKCIQSIKGSEASSPVTVHLTPLSHLTDEDVPTVHAPLTIECQERAIDCYETLNSVIGMLEYSLASLKTTPWILIVKQMEVSARELCGFKTSLDVAVKDGLQKGIQGNEEAVQSLENKINEFFAKYPKSELMVWIDFIADSSRILAAISQKLQEMNVDALFSKDRKVRFMMQAGTDDEKKVLISLHCSTISAFNCTTFFSGRQTAWNLSLWKTQDFENKFYSDVLRLDKKLQEDGSVRAAVEQAETEVQDNNIGMTLKEFTNGEWKPIGSIADWTGASRK